jgi:hypothetical protein
MPIQWTAIADFCALIAAATAVLALVVGERRSRLALQTDLLLKYYDKFYSPEMHRLRTVAAEKLLRLQVGAVGPPSLTWRFTRLGDGARVTLGGQSGQMPLVHCAYRYFERDDGERFDIGSADADITQQIAEVRWTGAQIRVWGRLFTGVPATEARHIEVERMEVTSGPAEEARAEHRDDVRQGGHRGGLCRVQKRQAKTGALTTQLS